MNKEQLQDFQEKINEKIVQYENALTVLHGLQNFVDRDLAELDLPKGWRLRDDERKVPQEGESYLYLGLVLTDNPARRDTAEWIVEKL